MSPQVAEEVKEYIKTWSARMAKTLEMSAHTNSPEELVVKVEDLPQVPQKQTPQ